MFQLFYISSSCAFDTFIWTLKILRYTGWKRYLKIIYDFWNKDSGDDLLDSGDVFGMLELDNEYQWSLKLYPIIYPHCFIFVE